MTVNLLINKKSFIFYLFFNLIFVALTTVWIVNNIHRLNFYTAESEIRFNESLQVSEINAINENYSLGLDNVNRVNIRELARYIINDEHFLEEVSSKFNINDTDNFIFKMRPSGNISILISKDNTRDYKEVIIGIESLLNEYINKNVSNRFLSKLKLEKTNIEKQINRNKLDIYKERSHIKTMLEIFPEASFDLGNGVILNNRDALALFEDPENQDILKVESYMLNEKLSNINVDISSWFVDVDSYIFDDYTHSFNYFKFVLLFFLIAFISLVTSGVFLLCYTWISNDRC